MILTVLITIIIEGTVVLGYSFWHKKPFRPILYTSIVANLITQSLLWVLLNLFFQHYLISLFLAEILIWIIESAMLYYVPANKLLLLEATFLSLLMNLASFGLGWFLPI
ncbi:MAG TPA: hypothetical protein VFQ23_10685 [Anaerolineales bacterium]|nr:hypothetical protein [Anaerolineales bacterium]